MAWSSSEAVTASCTPPIPSRKKATASPREGVSEPAGQGRGSGTRLHQEDLVGGLRYARVQNQGRQTDQYPAAEAPARSTPRRCSMTARSMAIGQDPARRGRGSPGVHRSHRKDRRHHPRAASSGNTRHQTFHFDGEHRPRQRLLFIGDFRIRPLPRRQRPGSSTVWRHEGPLRGVHDGC